MKIKIFNLNKITWETLEKHKGFENCINDFCSTVDVIDIVVMNADVIVVKYKDVVTSKK